MNMGNLVNTKGEEVFPFLKNGYNGLFFIKRPSGNGWT